LSAQLVDRETRRDNDDEEWRGRNMIKPVSLLFSFSLSLCSVQALESEGRQKKRMSTPMLAVII